MKTKVGLNGPANKIDSNETYGVLPYVAPEVLQGNPITKASDVYSFGILMWTLSAGIRPWCKRPHDLKLASEICNGLRPEIIDGTPNAYIQLMTQCLQSDPLRRPTASELNELLGSWITAISLQNLLKLGDCLVEYPKGIASSGNFFSNNGK
ncbi:14558_t:CDS:2 [Funneliformis geosporum]|nr:14558_t:CDS:2 [Funneliformis geosporum]